MSDQQRTTTAYLGRGYYDDQPAHPSYQAVKLLTAVTIGVLLLLLSGLILTGTVIGLILATPVLVVFSPILVPAAIALILAAMGFMFSGGCGVAAITTLTWVYNYVSGKQAAGSDRFDYGRMTLSDKARQLTEKAKEYGRDWTEKAKECGQQQHAQDRGHEMRQGY